MKTQYTDNFTKKRAERQRKARKKRIIAFFISFIILLSVTLITLCFTVFFPIERIKVSGSKIYSSEEICDASFVKTGNNIFAFSSENLEKEIRKKLPYIESVKVERSLDGILSIKVTDSKEKYCFRSNEGFFVIGKDSFVLNMYNEQPDNLLYIEGIEEDIKIGEYLSIKDTSKKEILDTLLKYETSSKINSINIADKYAIEIVTHNRFNVYLGTSNDIEQKMAHLNSMVEKIDENKSGKINLSYWSSKKPEGTFVEKKEKEENN